MSESYTTASTPPVSLALTAMGVPHIVFCHQTPVNSLEQAAAERGQTPEQIVRSILFRLGRAKDGDGLGDFAMVLMAGPGQIVWKTLRQHFGQSRLTMASAEEVLAVTGYPIGAVAPFGMHTEIPVLVDVTVTAQNELSMGSGVRGVAIVIAKDALIHALGPITVGQFGQTDTNAA